MAKPESDAMQAEALMETSPAGLNAANFILTKTFVRGNQDVDGYTYLLKLVIQHTLDLADQHPAQQQDYLLAAIPMTYNLAANTWPGWGDEFSAKVGPQHQKLGTQAARLNVELADQAKLGPERRKNGYWILGCHLLASQDYVDALEAFDASRKFANQAGDATFELAVTGWMHLTSLLRGEDRTEQLTVVERRLADIDEDGKVYAEQLSTALRVFGD